MDNQVLRRSSRDLKHKVKADIEPYLVQSWLKEHVGPEWNALKNRTGVWEVFWEGPNAETKYGYLFAEHGDAMLFTLKWL